MRIAWKARTSDPKIASYRYRVLAPLAELTRRGHAAELYAEERHAGYDTVIFSKAYKAADQALAEALRRDGCRVILDLCDNHFYNPAGLPAYVQARSDMLAMIALCDQVICSTPKLAEVVRNEAGLASLPDVVGDVFEAIDMPERKPAAGRRLLWFGLHGSPNAPSGMTDLLLIADRLSAAYARTPFELVVVSNNAAKYDRHIAPLPIASHYRDWQPQSFAAELTGADAVILPVSDNSFTACKTHNRLSLALATGVPVVADPIDSYREFAPFCYLGDWEAGLEAVLTAPDAARRRAAGARAYLEAHWSHAAIGRQWEAALGLQQEPAAAAQPRSI